MEYNRIIRTGDTFLMEVNGRFWGSLQLALDAGRSLSPSWRQLATGPGGRILTPYTRFGVK